MGSPARGRKLRSNAAGVNARSGQAVPVHRPGGLFASGQVDRLGGLDAWKRHLGAGTDVAPEAEAVAVNCYRSMLEGKGYLRSAGDSLGVLARETGSAERVPLNLIEVILAQGSTS
jgi:hypothetical protein